MQPTTGTIQLAGQRAARRLRRIRLARLGAGLILLNLAWRATRYGLGFPLWGDEAFVAVDFILHGFRDMLAPSTYKQIVPLGFMWAELGVTRLLGLSEYALRLLPFVCGVATMLIFQWWARRIAPRRTAWIAIGLLAASYYPVRYSVEVKPYAGDLLFGLLLLVCGWAVHCRPGDAARWLLLSGLAAIAVWCSYPSVFVAGGVGLVLGLDWLRGARGAGSPTRRVFLLPLLLYGLVLCTSFGAMYWLYGRPHAQAAAKLTEIEMWTPTFPPLGEPWKLPLWLLDTHAGNLMAYPVGGPHGGSIVTLLLVAGGCAAWWRTRRMLALLLVAPLLPNLAAAAVKAYPYGGSARVSLFMAPAFCLLAGAGIDGLIRWIIALRARMLIRSGAARSPVAARWAVERAVAGAPHVVLIVLALVAAGGLMRDVLKPGKTAGDRHNRRAIRELAKRTAVEDLWVVFNSPQERDYAPFIAMWGGEGARFLFYVLRDAPCQVLFAPRPGETAGFSGRIWLIANCRYGVFPHAQWGRYVAGFERQFGPGRYESKPIDTIRINRSGDRAEIESLEVVRYDAAE